MLHQVDEDPDALQIGSHRDALIGPVDAGGRLLRLRHEGTAPQAGVTDLLIVVGVRGPPRSWTAEIPRRGNISAISDSADFSQHG